VPPQKNSFWGQIRTTLLKRMFLKLYTFFKYMSGMADTPIDICEKVDTAAKYVALRSVPKLKRENL
jgi:hypothetical protein